MKPTILIVDDGENVRESFRLLLQDEHELFFAGDFKTTLKLLKTKVFDLCLLEISLPDGSGLDLLRQIKRRDESIDVIMVTALHSVDTALEAMKLGAYDYITKPFKMDELQQIIGRVLSKRALEKENRFLREERNHPKPVGLAGSSKAIQETLRKIGEAAKTEQPVLITGEMGNGPEDIAREIHRYGRRQREPFVSVSCYSPGRGHWEPEFFGQEPNESKKWTSQIGKLEFANGGTLFLDQVERLTLEAQEKLLRAFQENRIVRLGGTAPLPVDIRVIAFSEVDLSLAVERGQFRKDLYQYLNGMAIPIPPLRERKEDISEMIDYFLKSANQRSRIPVRSIHKDALQFLIQYVWPGNIHELENSVETMVLFAGKETLTLEDIPLDILVKQIDLAKTKDEAKLSLKRVRRQFERQYIRKVLEKTRGNQTRTAATLGLHRNTLIWKLKELGLEDDYKRIVKRRREHGVGFRDL